jgi:hypothetical protein
LGAFIVGCGSVIDEAGLPLGRQPDGSKYLATITDGLIR